MDLGIPRSVMWKHVATVDDRVTESLVGVVDAHLRTDTPAETLLGSLLHLIEVLEVILDAVITVLRSDTIEALLTHLRSIQLALR